MICTALYAPFALAPWGTLLAAHVDLSRFSAGWITLVVGFNTLAAIAIFGSRHWRHKWC
jgi:hypothetical protein